MSVTVLLLGGYATEVGCGKGAGQARFLVQIRAGLGGVFVGFIARPQFMLIFVYLPPAASEIMQCLY